MLTVLYIWVIVHNIDHNAIDMICYRYQLVINCSDKQCLKGRIKSGLILGHQNMSQPQWLTRVNLPSVYSAESMVPSSATHRCCMLRNTWMMPSTGRMHFAHAKRTDLWLCRYACLRSWPFRYTGSLENGTSIYLKEKKAFWVAALP